jgi:Fe/S biogenesis protein NfuA
MAIETTDTDTDLIVQVSEAAHAKILEILAEEDEPDTLGLRIEVTGMHGVEYAYDLSFETVAEADAADVRYEVDGLTVMIPADSVESLRGSTLDVPSNPRQGGLVIRNPNRPDPLAGAGPLELTGEVADKVTQLLEQRINPALSAHGGFANLVGVDGDAVYVTMGGGCQGCSMSAMTLTEGIKKMILESIPEVREVVDATNHSAGENPFYS